MELSQLFCHIAQLFYKQIKPKNNFGFKYYSSTAMYGIKVRPFPI